MSNALNFRLQTSLRFVGFFKPAPVPVSRKEGLPEQVKNDSQCSTQSELFHPFYVKKFTTLAPINSFSATFSRGALDQELGLGENRSTTDTDSDMDMDVDSVPQLGSMNLKAMLPSLFPNMGRRNDHTSRRSKLPPQTKSMSVPEVIQSGLLLQEHNEDLSYLLTWKDIPCLRMRLFQFSENYRPAYYGEKPRSIQEPGFGVSYMIQSSNSLLYCNLNDRYLVQEKQAHHRS